MPNRGRLDMHVADLFRRDKTRQVVVAPPVAVLSQWAEGLLADILLLDGQAVPVSTDALELQLLWAQALDHEMGFLADGERALAARQARAADRLLHHWWVDESLPRLESGFRNARNAVARQLKARQALSPEGWLGALAKRLESPPEIPCRLPRAIDLDGFHELTALEQKVLDALRQRGVRVTNCAPDAATAMTATAAATSADTTNTTNTVNTAQHTSTLASYPSLQAELTAAALWAMDQWQAGLQRIAVVVNGLDALANEVRPLFDVVISPHGCLASPGRVDSRRDSPFHIAAGEPLAGLPVIQDALALLEFSVSGLARPREFPVISRWLLSPHWAGSDQERASRARLEHDLRRGGGYWLAVPEVSRFARSRKPYDELEAGRDAGLAILLECCDRAAATATAGTRPAERFHQALQAWGWPGPLAVGTGSHRAVAALGGLLERLDQLEGLSAADTLRLLRQQCRDTTLVGRGGPLSPIQVITPEDAAGRHFDAAWVANMHDSNWPPQPRMNPFLAGQAMQRMPRSTAEGELAYCEALTAQVQTIAPQVRFSWCRQTGDVANAPSALLADLPSMDYPYAPAAALHDLVVPKQTELAGYRDHPWLVAVEDDQGLPLRPAQADQPAEPIRGGAGMLRDQSGCPMMAYLRHRLNARFEDMPAPFADAVYRGNLMHSAMHAWYAGHLDQPGVPPAADIPRAVQQALQHNHARQRLLPVSLRAEQQRLENVLREWRTFESERSGFSAHRLEEQISGQLGGHAITVKADRIDRLADGTCVIIDYKSSANNPTGWAWARLQQAQLPLYAVLLSRQDAIGGIALATVRMGECSFRGIVADPSDAFDRLKSFDDKRNVFSRTFAHWPALLEHWQTCIDGLADEIIAGACGNTLHDPQSLDYAGLDILLRRAEGTAWTLEHADQLPSIDEPDESDQEYDQEPAYD